MLLSRVAENAVRFILAGLGGGVSEKVVARAQDSLARLEGFEPTTLGSEDRCSVR